MARRQGEDYEVPEPEVDFKFWECTNWWADKETGKVVHCGYAESLGRGPIGGRNKMCPKCSGNMVLGY